MSALSTHGNEAATDYLRTRIDRVQARSVVMSGLGVVASEHPLASQAGATLLARGAHAVDAAIAANAVMGVVAPMMNGVGGDLFAIVYEAASGQVHGLNASGWAPAGLTLELLWANDIDGMPQSGIHSVTVPGAVSGWAALRDRFGRKPLSEILAAAIHHAEAGFPVSELTACEWAGGVPVLRGDGSASKTFLRGGRPPRAGEIFCNRDLAWTYRQIAAYGASTLSDGEVGRRLLMCSAQHGGTLAASDLAEFEAEWVEPISTTYRGWHIYELPPNGQGLAALMMLNVLENFPIGEFGPNSVDGLHTMIEVKKLAYADLSRSVADPRFQSVPVAGMLFKDYAAERASLIDPERARDGGLPGAIASSGGDTTYLSVVDRDGNMVSLIQSNFANFGSGLVPEGTGFVLQNRGGLFSADPTHPNALAPRKRPLHTIIPGFMQRDEVAVAFGVMGGWNQAQAHAQFVSNVVDHGMNIQAALETPRFTKLTFAGRDVLVESRIPLDVRAGLASKGHEVEVAGHFSSMVGGGQSVMRDRAMRVNYGASDPRKDGAAVPEPIL
jgi:gamma-glutamyltranspeptidase/glutathione hydrolase